MCRLNLSFFLINMQEASSEVIEFRDDDPHHFEVALKFLYTGTYDETLVAKHISDYHGNQKSVSQLNFAFGVLVVADKYDIQQLPDLIAVTIKEILVSDARSNRSMVPSHELIKSATKNYYEAHTKPNTPVGNVVAGFLLENQTSLSFVRSADFRCLLEEYPTLGADIALQLHTEGRLTKR